MPRVPGITRRRPPERARRYCHNDPSWEWQYESRNGLIPQQEPFVDPIGTSGAVQSLTTSATVPYPSNMRVGDTVLWSIGSADGTITTTAASVGFEEVLAGSATGVSDARVWRRVIDGTEGASVVLAVSGGTKGRTWMTLFRTYGLEVATAAIVEAAVDSTSDTNAQATTSALNLANGDRVFATLYEAGDFTTSAWAGYSMTLSAATWDTGGQTVHTAGRTGTSTFQHVNLSRRVQWGGSSTVTVDTAGGAPNTGSTGVALVVILRATVPVTAISQPVNPATETDTAQPLGRAKVRALGTAVETDAPIAVGRSKIRAVGINTEADAAQPLGRVKRTTVGITIETDAAQPTPRKTGLTAALGTIVETDAPIAVGKAKRVTLGVAVETDTAVAVGRRRSRALGIAAETETPLAFGKKKARLAGINAETQTAIAVTRRKSRTPGICTQTDAALAFARTKRLAIGIAATVEAAVAITAPLTDLSLQFVSVGTVQALTTTASVPYPTSPVLGDLIYLYVASGDSTITSGTPSGFTLLATASGGGVNDARLYVKPAAGGESGSITVTTSAGTKGTSYMALYRPPGTRVASVVSTTVGYDTSSDTSVAAAATGVATQANDRLIAFTIGAGDFTAGAFTGFNLVQTGATLGALGTRANSRTGTNTLQRFLLDKKVTVGATGTVTATGTGNTTAGTGSTIVVVARTSPGSLTAALGTATETETVPTLGRRKSRPLGVPVYSYGYGQGPYGQGPYGGGVGYSDNAMPVGIKTSPVLNNAIEQDDGVAVVSSKRKALGTAVEADTAMHLFPGITVMLGTAIEIDEAEPVTTVLSSVQVRIRRDLLPATHQAYVDLNRRGASGRLSRMYRMGSLTQRVLLVFHPTVEYPLGRVVVSSDLDLIESWDAGTVILDPEGYTTDNHSWEAGVLAANGYTMEAAP